MFKTLKLAAALILGLSATSSQAATFTYDLFDHPDGGLSAFDYGLRLDYYDRVFSFENGGDATLVYNDSDGTATISGTVRESLGNGMFGQLWDIVYSFTGLTDLGDGAFRSENNSGAGSISLGMTSLVLGTKSNGSYYFELDDDGHRLGGHSEFPSDTFVGRGWVDPYSNLGGANDFLFTAQISPVPLPAGVWLLLSGLLGIGVLKRRQRS